MPKLTSQQHERDPEELRAKLEAKERAVEANREKELLKIQQKQQQQEEHAKKVKERKKQLQGLDGDAPKADARNSVQRGKELGRESVKGKQAQGKRPSAAKPKPKQ